MPAEVIPEFVNVDGRTIVDVILSDRREMLLTIGGEPAFITGSLTCDTCRYIFNKVTPAQGLADGVSTETAEQLSEDLRDLRAMPAYSRLEQFAAVLAPGNYAVVLAKLTPLLVMPGGPADYFTVDAVATWGVDPFFGVGHSPDTPYYRLGTTDLGPVDYGGKRLGVVLGVPLFPPTQPAMNRQEVIAEYRATIRAGNANPTVLALGLADDRGPATWGDPPPEFSRHLVVTCYVLDGHHKIAAAAAESLPIQFLVFFPHQLVGTDSTEPVTAAVELLSIQSC